MIVMIAIVWFVSVIITIPPLVGWHDDDEDPTLTGMCIICQDPEYQVFATVTAFFLPAPFILCVYMKIYFVARSRIKRKKFNKDLKMKQHTVKKAKIMEQQTEPTEIEKASSGVTSSELSGVSLQCKQNIHNEFGNTRMGSEVTKDIHYSSTQCPRTDEHNHYKKQKDKIERKRERKAARTLGIITGTYIICWLPFFIVTIIAPFVDNNAIPELLLRIVLWLGYVNSLLNPVIYTVFSPEFRETFRKILCRYFSERL